MAVPSSFWVTGHSGYTTGIYIIHELVTFYILVLSQQNCLPEVNLSFVSKIWKYPIIFRSVFIPVWSQNLSVIQIINTVARSITKEENKYSE